MGRCRPPAGRRRTWLPGPGDPSTYLIGEQVLDVFTVEAIPAEVVLPQLAQPPVEMAPPGSPVPSPGDLGQPTIQFSPSTVEMGQVPQGSVVIPNLADFPFTARVTVSLIDSGGQGIQTVVSSTDLAFNPLEGRSAGFALNTGGLEPDTYGVRVVAVDAFTSTTLMAQNIPGGLQVTIPAALRGVNEFSDLRWFYGAEEPPAPLPSLPITKRAGDPYSPTFSSHSLMKWPGLISAAARPRGLGSCSGCLSCVTIRYPLAQDSEVHQQHGPLLSLAPPVHLHDRLHFGVARHLADIRPVPPRLPEVHDAGVPKQVGMEVRDVGQEGRPLQEPVDVQVGVVHEHPGGPRRGFELQVART